MAMPVFLFEVPAQASASKANNSQHLFILHTRVFLISYLSNSYNFNDNKKLFFVFCRTV